jgi:GNAT superfamily N-acetyltransferase
LVRNGGTVITFQVEKLADIRDEIWPLLARNAAESGVCQYGMPHDPDMERYDATEKIGIFRGVTARRDGAIVGYAAFFVTNASRSKGVKIAMCDSMWVAPEASDSTVGRDLIRFFEADLAECGCDVIALTAKSLSDMGRLYESMSYVEAERVYMKRVGPV